MLVTASSSTISSPSTCLKRTGTTVLADRSRCAVTRGSRTIKNFRQTAIRPVSSALMTRDAMCRCSRHLSFEVVGDLKILVGIVIVDLILGSVVQVQDNTVESVHYASSDFFRYQIIVVTMFDDG